jgi:hypothetical protein
VVVVAARFTVCVNVADVLPAEFPSPEYVAVIEWVPVLSDETASCALPLETVAVLSVVAPSRNETDPVAVIPVPVWMLAESVTVWPKLLGFVFEPIVVVVAARFTVCVSTEELLPAKFVSPE